MSVALAPRALDMLAPMHALLGPDAVLRGAGPTLRKLLPAAEGRPAASVFDLRGPGSLLPPVLPALAGRPLDLQLRQGRRTRFRGLLVPLEGGTGWLLNLAFGITELPRLGGRDLDAADFAATDMTVDMLYLLEANAAAMTEVRQLIARLQSARSAAEEQALTDALTGLKNRRALTHVLTRLTGQGAPFALTRLDLDFFKDVNDTHGHAAGDRVLQAVAEGLLKEVRGTDFVARVGGDEFVLVFRDLVDLDRIGQIAHRVIARLERPISLAGAQARVSASLGTTLSTFYRALDVERMLGDADRALYASKAAGRRRHTVYAPGGAAAPLRALPKGAPDPGRPGRPRP